MRWNTYPLMKCISARTRKTATNRIGTNHTTFDAVIDSVVFRRS